MSFGHKWWQRDQKSSSESKRTSTPDATQTLWHNYPNSDNNNWEMSNSDEKTKFGHKELDALVLKFQKRVEADKNYKFYTQDPGFGQNDWIVYEVVY